MNTWARKKNPFNKGFSLLLEGGDAPLEIKEEKENIPSGWQMMAFYVLKDGQEMD